VKPIKKIYKEVKMGSGDRDIRKRNRGGEMIGLYFMPVRKYHNETPHFAQLLYANKII
jgi:hypothetical protein